MKKYLFGLFAVALAIGFSAFTNTGVEKAKNGNVTTYSYKYTGPTSPGESDYESTSNWSTTISGCSGGSTACQVDVENQSTISAFVTFLTQQSSSVDYVNDNTISQRN